MAKFRNKKNGREIEVIQEDKKYKTVLVRFLDDDSEQELSTSTLKRWYEEVEDDDDEYEDDEDLDEEEEDEDEDYDDDDDDVDEDDDDSDDEEDEDEEEDDDDSEDDEEDEEELDDEEEDEDDEEEDSDDEDSEDLDDDDDEDEDVEDEEDEEEDEPAPKKGKGKKAPEPKKAAKSKKPAAPRKKAENSAEVNALVEYVESEVEAQGGEIFQPQSQPKNRAFKLGGHMYARLLYSVKSVTVACRAEAVKGTGLKPTKSINHMFSELYSYEKLDKTAKANIKKLLKASFDYQLKKNQGAEKPAKKSKKEKEAPAKTKATKTGKKDSRKEK